MKPVRGLLMALSGAGLIALPTAQAKAQDAPAGPGPESSEVQPAPGGGVVYTPGQTTVTHTYVPSYGYPGPGMPDVNENLPSSSRPSTDVSRASDGFDLGRDPNAIETLRGAKDSPAVLPQATERLSVPRVHTVKRGDTLWDLCDTYYRNPWKWPEIWAYNPQIQNPNWIYPGDQLRMRLGGGRPMDDLRTERGFIDRSRVVPDGTVFLRNYGFLGDPKDDTWGMLVGSRDEQMMLSDGDAVYMIMRPGVKVAVGQDLTVFREVRAPQKPKKTKKSKQRNAKQQEERTPPGEIVAVKGTIRVTDYNEKTRVARGELIESLDVVERGAKVGPVGRRFDVVPPRPSEADVTATVLTSFYPHVYFGKVLLVFPPRAAPDGLKAGNVLRIRRTGDAWRKTLKRSAKMMRDRMLVDVPENARWETTPLEGRNEEFPPELVGEVRVLRTQKYSSLALVTASSHEIVPGDRAVARRGQ